MLALGLAACDDPADPAAGIEAEADGAAEEDAGAEVDIAEHPIEAPLLDTEEYVGQQVSVSSDVEAILGTHAFTLAAPQGPFLVVSAAALGDNDLIERGAAVQVAGTVREQFSITDFEDEFAVDLDDELLTVFEGQTYVAADSVTEPQQEEDA